MVIKPEKQLHMYQKVLSFINTQKTFITLGRRSNFKAKVNEGILYITNSVGNTYEVDEQLFKLVYKRYQDLHVDLRNKTSQYTDPQWVNCPNRVASVYVAAIIRDYLNT